MLLIRPYLLAILLVLFTPWASFAQGVKGYYQPEYPTQSGIGFRAGTNYSFSTVTSAVVSNSAITSYLGGVTPRFGYYVGGFLYKDLAPARLTFRLDATLQMKGIGGSYMGKIVRKGRYYYAGLSPQIGVRLTDKLTVYSGVEANLLLAKQNSWGATYPFEIGSNLRVVHTFGTFRVEVGYFRGFNKVDRLELQTQLPGGSAINDFYNQNLQIGLLYNWTK